MSYVEQSEEMPNKLREIEKLCAALEQAKRESAELRLLETELAASRSREKEALALAAAYRDILLGIKDRCGPNTGCKIQRILSLPAPALKRIEALEKVAEAAREFKDQMVNMYLAGVGTKVYDLDYALEALDSLDEIEKEMKE